MRIIVKFSGGAHAELLVDLQQVPPRERAERLRLLAGIGLTVLRAGQPPGPPPPGPTDPPSEREPKGRAANGFNRIRERLKRGMG